jgi:hypothetical protein
MAMGRESEEAMVFWGLPQGEREKGWRWENHGQGTPKHSVSMFKMVGQTFFFFLLAGALLAGDICCGQCNALEFFRQPCKTRVPRPSISPPHAAAALACLPSATAQLAQPGSSGRPAPCQGLNRPWPTRGSYATDCSSARHGFLLHWTPTPPTPSLWRPAWHCAPGWSRPQGASATTLPLRGLAPPYRLRDPPTDRTPRLGHLPWIRIGAAARADLAGLPVGLRHRLPQ